MVIHFTKDFDHVVDPYITVAYSAETICDVDEEIAVAAIEAGVAIEAALAGDAADEDEA